MPLQYQIEYRWDDNPKVASFKKPTKKPRSKSSEKSGSGESQPVTTDKTAKPQDNGGTETEKTKSGRTKSGVGSGPVGKERGGKTSARPGLEKVVLPAGCCVYYARGRGAAPLLQFDSHQGQVGLLRSNNNKGLGIVNPDSHNVVEEEYAIIREVMEIYLEKQVSQGEEGDRYRAGGQLEQQKQLLEELMLSLPPDTEGPLQTLPEAFLPVHAKGQASQSEAPSKSTDTSRSLPTTRLTGRCLLPISKALRTDLSPRGPFLMEGQSALDTGRDDGDRYQPQDKQSEADSDRLFGIEDLQDFHHNESSDIIDDPREHYFDTKFRKPLEDKHNVFVTELKSMTPRFLSIKQKDQQLEMKYGLIRTVDSHSQKSPRHNVFKRKGFLTNRPMRCVIPHKQESLLLVSERSPLEHRKQDTARLTARGSHTSAAQSTEEVLCSEKPVNAIFKERVKGKATGRTFQQWKPVASHARQTREGNWLPVKKEKVDGYSLVTQMPAKLVLDVVLPRENKSREINPQPKNVTGTLYRPQQKPALQDLIPTPCSPPPPPPPSAPTNADGDDWAEYYVLNHDSAGDGDDDGEMPYSCSASSCSATSHPSSVAETQFLEESVEPVPALHAVDGEREPSSRLVIPNQPSGVNKHTASPVSPSPAVDEDAGSSQRQYTTAPIRSSSQDSARSSTHSAASRHSGDTQRTRTPCPKALHCDVLGPGVCGDCEAALHRRHFTAQQRILYPHISATPRHMVASRKMKSRQPSKEGAPHGAALASSASWSHAPEAPLNDVVTDLELCRRIVEKGHRARLPSSFS